MFPITGTCTYATSGDAMDAMLEMQTIASHVTMRVSQVRWRHNCRSTFGSNRRGAGAVLEITEMGRSFA
jgi:hypothetical protein